MRDDVVRLLSREGDAWAFDDVAVKRLVAMVQPLEGAALIDACRQLMRVAQFLDVQKKSPGAAATLLTLVVAMGDKLHAADALRTERATEDARAKLAQFRGDQRVAGALESGRPEGTIPAGPGARFRVNKP